jgi:hypothetical protein
MTLFKIDYNETLSQYWLYSIVGGFESAVFNFGSFDISHAILYTSLGDNTVNLRFNSLSDLTLAINNIPEAYKLVLFFYGDGESTDVDFNIKSTNTLTQTVRKWSIAYNTELAGHSEENFDISYANYFMSKKSVAYREYYSNHNKIFEPIFNLLKDKTSLADDFQKAATIGLYYRPDNLLVNNLTKQLPVNFEGLTYTGNVSFTEASIDLDDIDTDPLLYYSKLKLLYIMPEYSGVDYVLRFSVVYKNKPSQIDVKVTDRSLLKLPHFIDKLVRVDLLYDPLNTMQTTPQLRVGNHVFTSSFLTNPHHDKSKKNLYTISYESPFLKILDYNYSPVSTFEVTGLPTTSLGPILGGGLDGEGAIVPGLGGASNQIIFFVDDNSNIYASVAKTLYATKLNKPLCDYKNTYTTVSDDIIDIVNTEGAEYLVSIDLQKYSSNYSESEYILKIGSNYYNSVTDEFQETVVTNKLEPSSLSRLEFEITSTKNPTQIILTNSDKSVVKEAYVETPELAFRAVGTLNRYYGYAEDKFIFSDSDGVAHTLGDQSYGTNNILINNEPRSVGKYSNFGGPQYLTNPGNF